MNIDFEAALRYIDLGSYDKAVEKLISAIDKEQDNPENQTKYRCVLGELYANLGKLSECREEFNKVIDYCDETHTLQQQRAIASAYVDALDKKLIDMAIDNYDKQMNQPQPVAKRPGDVPLVPKPVQNKAFIAKQSRKNHK